MADIGTAYIRIAPNMTGIQGKISSGLKGSGSNFAAQFGSEVSGKSALIIGAIAGVTQAATQKAMALVTSSIGDAIKRVDTLNNSARTFQNMGFTAKAAKTAMDALNRSILGLPTSLDEGVRGMTKIAASINDLPKAQKVFSALNDAILGFGGTSDMVSNAVTQLSQDLGTGRITAQTWLSLTNSGLTPALAAMARQMGITTKELKKGLSDGSIGVDKFINSLIMLDTKGGGGMKSFQTIAHDATAGIGSGWRNMQVAITRGIANIIQAIGSKNISNAIASIGKGFETLLTAIARQIPKVVGIIKGFVDFIVRYKDIFAPLAVGAAAAVAAMLAFGTVMKVIAIINGVKKALIGAQTAMALYTSATGQGIPKIAAFNAAFGANPILIVVTALAAVTAALVYFFAKTETGKKIFANFVSFLSGVWSGIKSGIKSVGDFFSSVWSKVLTAVDAVKGAFNTAKDAVVGFISAGINILNGAMQATLRWLYAWRHWFINIGIVIGTIVAPKLVQLGIQALKAAAQWIKAAAQMAAASIKSAAQSVKSFVLMSASATKNAGIASWAWIQSAAKSAYQWVTVTLPAMIKQFALASWNATINAAKTTWAWATAAAQTLLAWAKTFIAYGIGVATAAAQTFMAGARMAAGWLLAMGPIGLIVAAVAGATALIIANWNSVKGWLAAFWNWLKSVASGTWNAIKAGISAIGSFFTGIFNGVKNIVGSVWGSIKNGAANMINGLVSFFSGLPGRIARAVGNMGKLLYDKGKDLIQGLLDGAGSLLSKIGTFFLDKIPGWIKEPFKKALGIHSPSKVFAGYGGNIAEGLINGIANKAGAITKAVNDMSSSAIAGMTTVPAGFNVGAGVSADYAAPGSGSQVASSPSFVQNNNIFNQVDLNTVAREMAWRIKR